LEEHNFITIGTRGFKLLKSGKGKIVLPYGGVNFSLAITIEEIWPSKI